MKKTISAIWVYGTEKSLEWHAEHPNYLYVEGLNQPTKVWKRGNDYVGEKSTAAGRATRTPSGHPEAFLEAVGNIYKNFADTVIAKLNGQIPDELMLDFPNVDDGVRGMVFIDTVVKALPATRNGLRSNTKRLNTKYTKETQSAQKT